MLIDVTMEHYDRLMDVDLRGVLLGMKHAIRVMLETGNGGSIVNWSSLGGMNGSYFTSVYSAAKAGVIAITKAAAIEYGAQGIRANCLCPGFIYTAMSAGGENIPGMLEKAALEPRRAARGGRGGRRVPRVRPRLVRLRRDHPRRRRVGREARMIAATDAWSRRGCGAATSARASIASRTRACSPVAARYVDDISLPGMLHAVLRAQPPRPRRDPRRSTRRPRSRCPGVHAVFTAADLNPDVKEQWHTSIGARQPGDAAPAARRGRGPLRRRPGRARRRREPRTSPQDAAELVDVDYEPLPAVVDYTEAEHATALVHEPHGSNVIGELAGLPESALDDVFAAAAHVTTRDDLPAGVRAGADRRRAA